MSKYLKNPACISLNSMMFEPMTWTLGFFCATWFSVEHTFSLNLPTIVLKGIDAQSKPHWSKWYMLDTGCACLMGFKKFSRFYSTWFGSCNECYPKIHKHTLSTNNVEIVAFINFGIGNTMTMCKPSSLTKTESLLQIIWNLVTPFVQHPLRDGGELHP